MSSEEPKAGVRQGRHDLSTPGKRYEARLQQRTLSTILQQRIIEKEQATLATALDRIQSDGSAIALAKTVVAARRRFVTGSGKSFAYATLLAQDLSAGLAQVFLIDDTVIRMIDILSEVKETDVLVAFSLRRYRRDTLELCRLFVQAGGTLVAITDEPDSPITSLATVSVCVPIDSVSYTDSPTAVTAIIHIVTTLSTASSKGARRRLAERDKLSHELDLYVDQ